MNSITGTLIRFAVLAACLAPVLMGCAALSTGASMRVEVEVYKGPLSKHREVQLGEIIGVIREAKAGLEAVRIGAETYAKQIGCLATNKSDDCKALEAVIGSADDLLARTAGLVRTADELKKFENELEERKMRLLYERGAAKAAEYGKAVDEFRIKKLLSYTNQVSALAVQFKAKAFFITEYQLKAVPDDEKIRVKLTEFTTLTSEFSNQLASRTTVLQKQYDKDVSGQKLAVSDHLRDAEPTAFLNLYDWYRATYSSSKSQTGLAPADRVRLAQQLFADHYWTKINEVYASGQGDVSMALIKDDIGNWNLKSFENNPTKLLDAYRNLSLAAIEATIKVAKTIPSGGTTAALDLASQFASGRVGSTGTALAHNVQIQSLHRNVEDDLARLLARAKKKMPDLKTDVIKAESPSKEDLDADLKQKRNTLLNAENAVQQQKRRIIETQEKYETQKCELDKIQESLAEVRNQLTVSPSDQTLVNRENVLRGREQQQQETVTQTEKEREELKNGLEGPEGLHQNAKNARAAFDTSKADAKSSERQLAEARKAQRDFAVEIMREARKILEVHRRVIKALVEAQTSASSSNSLQTQNTPSPAGRQSPIDWRNLF